jgi:hypothetical protein
MEQANLAPNLVGANTIDKEVPVNIDISYLQTKYHDIVAQNDLENIRRQMKNSDTSALTGLNMLWIDTENETLWIAPESDDEEYRYLRINYWVRITVTY